MGNDGMVRVCARRAAGIAVSFWLQSHLQAGRGTDAMTGLRRLHADTSMPQHVREAAFRLTVKVTDRFTSPFPANPLDDCRTIIAHLMATPRG
jgi:hypothetical protein